MTKTLSTQHLMKQMRNKTPIEMKYYSIDFDILKMILACEGVEYVDYRLSASKKGFHYAWNCSKRTCRRCSKIEQRFDDEKRYSHDKRRPYGHRRILWGIKGGHKAGSWKRVYKERII